MRKKRIVVAMSGGVDSSTVAAMLKEQNYDVIGITLKLYDTSVNIKGSCCAGQDIYDAKAAAKKIDIPHYVLDYEKIFKERVIDNFINSYAEGETPIPCIQCNQKIKFQDLCHVSKTLNADFMATGHYVRKVRENNKNMLYKAIDCSKDQSYFLFTITKKQLDFLYFPLGELKKQQTRELAKRYKLDIADKPESQDICFVQGKNYAELIKKLNPENMKSGNILLQDGSIIGKHQGISGYTIGQRKRIGVSYKHPLYVIKIDKKNNTIVVGDRNKLKNNALKIKNINWLLDDKDLKNEIPCNVRLRSNHNEIPAKITYLGKGNANVLLKKDYDGITPGQACVFYDGERVLGGGWITESSNE